jgi:hypothetical protein
VTIVRTFRQLISKWIDNLSASLCIATLAVLSVLYSEWDHLRAIAFHDDYAWILTGVATLLIAIACHLLPRAIRTEVNKMMIRRR